MSFIITIQNEYSLSLPWLQILSSSSSKPLLLQFTELVFLESSHILTVIMGKDDLNSLLEILGSTS